MANLGDFGKFRLIVWRDENPSTVNEISVAVLQTDYAFSSDAAQATRLQTWKIIRQETIKPFFEESL